MKKQCIWVLLGAMVMAAWDASAAGSARIAVASNFLGPARALAAEFKRGGGEDVDFSAGSTGMLYTQILNGAPFDAFLAANAEEPQRLEQQGLSVAGSRFTYATGVLALWAASPGDLSGDGAVLLRTKQGASLAIANPKTAPYGAAAMATLQTLVVDRSHWRIIQGENISQAYQFVATGNAQFGFVALSQLREAGVKSGYWQVPGNLYPVIRQQALLLKHGERNAAAQHWLKFLHSPEARKIMREIYGYGEED